MSAQLQNFNLVLFVFLTLVLLGTYTHAQIWLGYHLDQHLHLLNCEHVFSLKSQPITAQYFTHSIIIGYLLAAATNHHSELDHVQFDWLPPCSFYQSMLSTYTWSIWLVTSLQPPPITTQYLRLLTFDWLSSLQSPPIRAHPTLV